MPEYKDDHAMIPRASSVLVKRLPSAPGKGTAQRYVASLNTIREEKPIVSLGIAAKKYPLSANSDTPISRLPRRHSPALKMKLK